MKLSIDVKKSRSNWRLSVNLYPPRIYGGRFIDALVGLLIHIQKEIVVHKWDIYSILSELYANAVEHGLLGLSSAQKKTAAGFADYCLKLQERLAALEHGGVNIDIRHFSEGQGGRLVFSIKDDGPGFDYVRFSACPADESTYCGRGISLVRSLCRELTYQSCGNIVEAVYVYAADSAWSSTNKCEGE
ncbi:MAG: ATP-binding protein [Deltaproteobacteria bacterium]|nr:ATP-binding protein [Deltaproteobacteria bacterium]